ncbi:protoporphyrinogen oxidase 2-like isoform X4 [Ziziphus jujuba]|uniref:Protoporphyrinogen oxidase 2-like isoform X4 n=1 Tax=Ziziphus jujuba TaxID=326968 RepID=A0ABM3ZSL3_ZIZJJ|nr:protoporphyrinogen oxidase 2-like isoform X4 [Ziziphus jujuba]XP_060667469.1 protoporphyrinogen oxidase 2-like isoform X4 [Ziziphus jujuba]XP_060667470.1 protoporphyrinogen oxidase 2-like isoform X4 [Ziziphus jujuba]XP_060667471.1 protoporphyrinogen oxidase 2-like isoform X4 [Ziziphus jujuba]
MDHQCCFRSFWSHFCGRKGAPQMFLIIVKKAFYLILCSVGGFFQRYFGKEVVDYLIDPFVEGTSTGDPEYLSMCYSFPDLWNLEERFGSFIAGAIQSKLSSRKEKSGEKKGSLKKQSINVVHFLSRVECRHLLIH